MLDQTDIKILKLLSQNSRMKLKTISKKVSLSEPSVKNRIERLVEEKVLKSFTIDIDYKKLGFKIPVLIKVSDLTVPYKEFVYLVKDIEEFVSIYSVTGEENYIIVGRTKSVVDVEKLLGTLMKYGKVSTSIILEEIESNNLIDYL